MTGKSTWKSCKRKCRIFERPSQRPKSLCSCISKSRLRSCPHVILRTGKDWTGFGPTVNNDSHELFDTFAPLIVAAGRQRFRLTAKENQVFLRKSQVLSRYPPNPYRALPRPSRSVHQQRSNCRTRRCSTTSTRPSARRHSQNPHDPDDSDTKSIRTRRISATRPQPHPRMPKVLRHIQRGQSELEAHLAAHPQHKVPFVKKRYNELNKKRATPRRAGRHKCRVCGASSETLVKMETHCERFKHNRTREQGNVGRWRQDNGWYRYPGGRRRGPGGGYDQLDPV
jgi:hypothetical protein